MHVADIMPFTDYQLYHFIISFFQQIYFLINFAWWFCPLVVRARRRYMPCGRAETSISVPADCNTHWPLRV